MPNILKRFGLRPRRYMVQLRGSFLRRSDRAGRRTRIHHVYYLLAAFDLAAIVTGLSLAHHLNGVLFNTVQANLGWNTLHDEIAILRGRAGLVNAPGNNVFESKKAAQELKRFDNAVAAFWPQLTQLRHDVSQKFLSDAAVEPSHALDAVEVAMTAMAKQTRSLLEHYAKGDVEAAGAEMAAMDRSYSDLLKQIEAIGQVLRRIEHAAGRAELEATTRLQILEYVLGIVILLMVLGVTVYGNRLGKLFQTQYDALAALNSRLTRRTRELQAANENVTNLNAELESTIIKLQGAQAEMVRKEELLIQNARFDAALDYMPAGLSMFDSEQRLIVCNRVYREIYDVPEELARPGTPLAELVRYYVRRESGIDVPEDLESERKWIAGHVAQLACGKPFTYTQQLSNGRTILVGTGPLPDGGWVDVQEDITEQRQTEAKITHLARHDALTDLPNRVFLHERLEHVLNTERRDEYVTVLYLDLDRFKEVNDTLGHPIGDMLLKAVAERLASAVRESDTVARVGGDEFVVVQVSAEPSKEAAALAARLIEVISAPYDLNGHEALISTSIGIAISPHDGTDCTTLMKHADMALYRSKNDGHGSYCFFEQEMNVRVQARRELEQDLRSAFANGELEINYQPIVNLERNAVCGCEALLRWRHPKRGMIAPGEFIPLAEETGLIVPIGEWVLRQACSVAATWPDRIKIAVNLSPVQCKSRTLFQMVFNAVAAAGIAPQRLELEITESALLQEEEVTLANLQQLHDFGARIAMDDFGTGYSSLSYLRKFPFDKIKIDRCFVTDLSTGNESALAIVSAIIRLAGALGLTITAEGVETHDQLEMLRIEGCTEIQGYIFSAAKPANEIRRLFLPRAKELARVASTAAA